MTSKYFTISLSAVAHDDEFREGRRFATDWKGSDGRMWRVSSVDHESATETMVFLCMDGEPTYFDLDSNKEFTNSRCEHGRFLQEYLQRELDYNRAVAEGEGSLDPDFPTMVLMDRFSDLYGAVAIDEMDEDEGRPF